MRLLRLLLRSAGGRVAGPVAAGVVLGALAGTASAADLEPSPPAAPVVAAAPVADADALVVTGTFYLWATKLSGTTSTLPPLPPTHVDLSFRDVLEDLDGGIMGAIELRKNRWIVIGDLMLTQVSPDGTLPGPYASKVEVVSRSLTLEGAVLYRLYESDALNVDAGGGVRYWHLDNSLTIEPGLLPNGFSMSEMEDWADPLVVGRIQARLGGPWSLTLTGDIGGFGVGSQSTWQVIGTVNYQWNDKLSLRAGYRALSVDYENGSFLYDVVMQGPVFGVAYRF